MGDATDHRRLGGSLSRRVLQFQGARRGEKVTSPRRSVCGENDRRTETRATAVAYLLFGAPLANCTLLGAPAAWAQEPPPSPATCEGRTELAPEMATCLQMGQVDLQGVTITGSLDLSALGTIASPLRCVDCTVQGDVIAADVTFERLVTLERVVVEGDLDAHGARFEGAVLTAAGVRIRPEFVARPTSPWPASRRRSSSTPRPSSATCPSRVLTSRAQCGSGTDMHGKVTFDRIVAAETFAMDGVDPFNPSLEAGRADAEVLFRNATFARDLELSGRSFNGGLVATGSRVQGRLAIRRRGDRRRRTDSIAWSSTTWTPPAWRSECGPDPARRAGSES